MGFKSYFMSVSGKWAVGGFTEAIAQEVAPFGVRVCALEPGGMRTRRGKRASAGTPKLLPEYEASVSARIQMLQGHWGHEMSDPAKVAQVILQFVSKDQLPAHLLLGSDAVQYARLAEEKRDSDAKGWRDISVSTDAQDEKGLPDLKL
jgi:NAD(P)-dependent dehydrogenase (short-subunit alcohol dehydrogenase family)